MELNLVKRKSFMKFAWSIFPIKKQLDTEVLGKIYAEFVAKIQKFLEHRKDE